MLYCIERKILNRKAVPKALRIFLLIIFLIAILMVFLATKPDNNTEVIRVGEATIRVEISDELAEQIQGLSNRDSLCPDCGMLFVYDDPQILTFWMKDMKFALDIIFIREGKITEIYENVPAPRDSDEIARVVSRQKADAVLEVNAGFAREKGFKISDEVRLD